MEIENYKNLSDWLLSGSRQMTKREFCYILTLENVGLPETVRYFNVLRAFLQEPITDKYLQDHWEGIEKNFWKWTKFPQWLAWFIGSHCTSTELVASAKVNKDKSIVITYNSKN